MSRERELLKRTMDFLECFVFYNEGLELREAIRDFLSTPEPEQDEEPVAWTNRQEINALNEECTVYMYAEPMEGEDNIPLFLHPAPRPEFVRLSEEELRSCFTETNEAEPLAEGWPGLERFAQAIEDALEEKNRDR